MSFRRPSTPSCGRRFAALFFLTVALAFATPSTNAARRDGSGSGSSALSSVWEADDACNAPITAAGCIVGVTCNACLSRPGCAIESTTGKCVSSSRINASVGIEYFESGKEKYCIASDDACSACGASSTSGAAVCRGVDGCICVRQCEINPVVIIECTSAGNGKLLLYGIIACAIIAPMYVFSRVQKRWAQNMSTNISRFMVRERREARRKANPLTMKLDGWRSYIESEPKGQPTKIELKRCSRLQSDASSMEEGRKTEDSDTLSPSSSHLNVDIVQEPAQPLASGDQYVSVSTPRGVNDARSDRI